MIQLPIAAQTASPKTFVFEKSEMTANNRLGTSCSALKTKELTTFARDLGEWVNGSGSHPAAAAIALLGRYLDAPSLNRVEELVTATGTPSPSGAPSAGLLGIEDLDYLIGYFRFLDSHGFRVNNVPFEIRIERRSGGLEAGFLAYGLVPLDCSLLGGFSIPALAWTHSEDLVHQRFTRKPVGPYVCGSYVGRRSVSRRC